MWFKEKLRINKKGLKNNEKSLITYFFEDRK